MLERIAALVLGLYLAGGGLHAMGEGRWSFDNYLGLPVSAPLSVVVGLGLVVWSWRAGARPAGDDL